MQGFTYKETYVENGKRVLEINILPERYCNFDCIFCPVGRSPHKMDTAISFGDMDEDLQNLESLMVEADIDLVFINSKGEAFINEGLETLIDFVRGKGKKVKILTNGYLLGRTDTMAIASKCDEVFGEVKLITEETFKKVQRPLDGYTVKDHITNMASFNRQYGGDFILEVTLVKGYTDDDASVEALKGIIAEIDPQRLIVTRIEDEPFKKKLCVEEGRFEEIVEKLHAFHASL